MKREQDALVYGFIWGACCGAVIVIMAAVLLGWWK